jgi:putative flippase GtrA
MARFGRFALVGGTGFCIDTGVLAALLHGTGLDPFSARAVSISVAALSTWRLNRMLTFGASAASQVTEAVRYAGVAAAAAALNYALYVLALLLAPGLPPVGAVVIATAVAMTFSYLGYSRYVFGDVRSTVLLPPRSHSR